MMEFKSIKSGVRHCPPNFPASFYWYGGKQRGPGRPPKWVEQLLKEGASNRLAKNTVEEQQGNMDKLDSQDANDPEERSSTQCILTSVEPKISMRNQQHYQLHQNPRRNMKYTLSKRTIFVLDRL